MASDDAEEHELEPMSRPSRPKLEVLPGGLSRAASLDGLYRQYGASVYGRCRYLLRDSARAEDAMQEVFAKAWSNLDGFRAEASPLTWLVKIATNHCLNVLRAERAPWRRAFRLFREASATATGPSGLEDRETVRQLLSRFDAETQAAAVHYFVDEMTLEEVATLLGRSVPTVRKRLETFAAASGQEIDR